MRLAVIADDLTGSLDASAPFASAGLPVVAPLSALAESGAAPALLLKEEEVLDAAVLALNLETRSLTAAEAAARVAAACSVARELGVTHWFKKMDSTLRGPWAEELAALRSALEVPLVLVCPAFPAQGRTVEEGVVHAGGERVGDCIAELSWRSGLRVTGLPTSSDTLAGLAAVLREGGAEHCQALVADAQSDDQLDALVAAARQWGLDRVLCGSGGLAAAWARGLSDDRGWHTPAVASARRILVAVGSRHPAARRQLEALCIGRPAGGAAVEITLLICPPGDTAVAEDERLAERIGEEALCRHAAESFQAMVLTGGQTALAALRGLGGRRLRVLGELEPGLALSRIEGGAADGLFCVTKAGGFGDDRTLLRVIDHLSTEGARDGGATLAGPDPR